MHPETSGRVRLAALGDLHCSRASVGSFRPILAEAVSTAHVLALCGDLTDRGLPEEAHVLAHEITKTVTVNKSLGVVLGVGPLLAINVLYTIYFYSANALTGYVWISIVPLVATAFLILYAHKYSWDRLAGSKRLHMAIGWAGVAILLFVPLIFLTNINLMLFPERWTQVKGFASALVLPNVLPRFLHFLLACLAVTALFRLRDRVAHALIWISATMLLGQVLLMRWNVVIGGQLLSKSMRGFTDYFPGFWHREGLVMAAAIFTMPFVILYVFHRIVPLFPRREEVVS
jgi:hypothetical protein